MAQSYHLRNIARKSKPIVFSQSNAKQTYTENHHCRQFQNIQKAQTGRLRERNLPVWAFIPAV